MNGVQETKPSTKKRYNRTSKACTLCRKRKLRCDAMENFPFNCTQCRKSDAHCEIDVNVKRPVKFPKAEWPLDELRGDEVAASKGNAQLVSLVPPANSKRSGQSDDNAPLILPRLNPGPGETGFPMAEGDDKVLPDERIGEIIISGTTIKRMFLTFYKDYIRYVPVFPLILTDPEKLVGERKILFWAICAVVSPSCAPEYQNLLYDHVQQLLGFSHESMSFAKSSPGHAHCRIFSLILFCNWPSLRNGFKDDQTWTYSGQAVTLAMQLGLHQCSFAEEYMIEGNYTYKDRHASIASLCWAAVFISHQFIVGSYGFRSMAALSPGIYQDLSTIAAKNTDVAKLVSHLKIAQALKTGIETLGCSSVTNRYGTVDSLSRGLVHSSVINSFSQLISTIDNLDPLLDLHFLYSKLQLHCFLLLPDTLPADQKTVAVPIYSVCMKIIRLCKDMNDSGVDIYVLPSVYSKICIMAAIILFGLSISPLAELIDTYSCRNAILEWHNLMAKLKRQDNDIFDRSMRVVNSLQQMYSMNLFTEPLFYVRSRLGSGPFLSIMFTCKRYHLRRRQLSLEKQQKGTVEEQSRKTKNTSEENTMANVQSEPPTLVPPNNEDLEHILDDIWNFDFEMNLEF